MRVRLARPRRAARGRLVAPVAAAAAVALVGGVVVAAPDAPTSRDDVQAVSLSANAGFNAGVEQSLDIEALAATGSHAGLEVTGVTGLPDGMVYEEDSGIITGAAKAAGIYTVEVSGTLNGMPVTVPVTVTVNAQDGTPPAGAQAGSAVDLQGSLGGEAHAGGQITTGSAGADAVLGVVAGLVGSLTGDSGSTGQTTPENGDDNGEPPGEGPTPPERGEQPEQPGDEDQPGTDEPDTDDDQTTSGSLQGSTGTGQATGGADGTIDTQSLGPVLGAPLASLGQTGSTGETATETPGGTNEGETTSGSLIDVPGSTTTGDTTVGGETETTGGSLIDVPGSTTTGGTNGEGNGEVEVTAPGSTIDSGSLGNLAPVLAVTGAGLLGLAGLSLLLNGGSSTPGSTSVLPVLPGSTTTGGNGSSGSTTGENLSSGSTTGAPTREVTPTVAAGAPAPAPGPEVANGRG